MSLSSRKTLALVLAVGVVVPGVLNYWISAAGYDTLGSLVWALGYGTVVLVVWVGWIRPLNITGPDDEQVWSPEDDPNE